MKKYYLTLAFSLLLGWTNSYTQFQSHIFAKDGYPRFSADYTCFKAAEGKSYVEIYTQISFKDLQFIKQNEIFLASYEIEVNILKDEKPYRQRSFIDTVVVNQFAKTIAAYQYRLSVQGFLLEPGKYETMVMLTDLETRKAVRKKFAMTVPTFSENTLSISGLQFARRISLTQDRDNPFVKNGRLVEPNVPRAYGFLATKVYLYYEIYGLEAPTTAKSDQLVVNYKITTTDGVVKKNIQKRVDKPGPSSVHSVLIPIADLQSGRYTLEVDVYDPADDQRVGVRKDFIVGWDLLTFSDNNSDELVKQLSIIASDEEINQLKMMPRAYRRAGILNFWKSKDPTPNTEFNEFMAEFYRRVAYANVNFQYKEGKGWETDQGKIYIKYGPPDSIQRFLGDVENKPYEVWEYLNPRRRFVFIEKKNLGTYKLFSQAIPGISQSQ